MGFSDFGPRLPHCNVMNLRYNMKKWQLSCAFQAKPCHNMGDSCYSVMNLMLQCGESHSIAWRISHYIVGSFPSLLTFEKLIDRLSNWLIVCALFCFSP